MVQHLDWAVIIHKCRTLVQTRLSLILGCDRLRLMLHRVESKSGKVSRSLP